jgi:hypothetical protein
MIRDRQARVVNRHSDGVRSPRLQKLSQTEKGLRGSRLLGLHSGGLPRHQH